MICNIQKKVTNFKTGIVAVKMGLIDLIQPNCSNRALTICRKAMTSIRSVTPRPVMAISMSLVLRARPVAQDPYNFAVIGRPF